MAERKLYVVGDPGQPKPEVPEGQTLVLHLRDADGVQVRPAVIARPHPYFHSRLGEYLGGVVEQLDRIGWTAERVRLGL